MNNAAYILERPANEPARDYRPGSEEVRSLLDEVERQRDTPVEIPLIIGGREIRTGDTGDVVMPHDHAHKLGVFHKAGEKEVRMAIEAALDARGVWAAMPWEDRAAVALKAAELVSVRYRDSINAAAILCQSKNIWQAEIDSACEIADFLRFNCYNASQIFSVFEPVQLRNTFNIIEFRPLEGFVYAVTPFNFTAIACNLNMAPVILGNVTVWKPATASILSSWRLMEIYKEAGLPEGVINFLPGSGSLISKVVLGHKYFAGLHFTGSNETFNELWRQIADNLPKYRSYPRIVGETGGKDFIFAHGSADPDELSTAIVLGAFEYQGQKCSASSRSYIPKSLWPVVRKKILERVSKIRMGDPADPKNLMGAVIDEKSFDFIAKHLEDAKKSPDVEILTGGGHDKSKGYFIEPTVLVCRDPKYATMETELFGPVMSIYVYEDDKYEETLKICDDTSAYGLTGSIFSRDRKAAVKARELLTYAAGNFYINDKTTGAVVGQQPFGGSRASGTNDKVGSAFNLVRWLSPRSIKDNYTPPKDIDFPHMG
ncbi:MAG: L-glutamate gamma-semialdehyde dehydrogenase [Synergistaceae bacterium]|jgi:1-pyrroline-5-carboxylate dehydrogenase|nr:L-glutamate gamma-semialdehyde dehydrogenase [Synergistaceae bacterium]